MRATLPATVRIAGRAGLVLACLATLLVFGRGEASPRPSASPSPSAGTRARFSSAIHGYALEVPAGWALQPDASGVADIRLTRLEGRRLSGSVQVFERAFWTSPTDWYQAARSRYEGALASVPAIEKLDFGPLESTTLGGLPGHCFEFRAMLRQGGVVTTRIAFIPRPQGQRTDVLELVLTGEPGAFDDARSELAVMEAKGLVWQGDSRK